MFFKKIYTFASEKNHKDDEYPKTHLGEPGI
jgi:hypothetical protein